ncbi:hypothetical protein NQ314_016111 [Rhamnusium bicolor]|uniref:Anaphase-promoting complex subunit 4-like WD40 domain-containing protein n=1 Tax=Rhamnusium bicolor TaxID=1586634 RepID=A0AAV8WWH7_9CUCU|nr:hypothetical protein NQ314_016111 [Rhamnusium bicolor]
MREMSIATASTTVKFHEFPSGNVTHNYQPGTRVEGPIRSISWSKDGDWLGLVPHSGFVEIVSVKDQLKLVKSIQDVNDATCASFPKSGKKHIALGTKSGLVLIYDVKAKNTKKTFPKGSSMITHVDFTAKDTHCVAGCRNGDVLLYSNVTNTLSCTFRVPKSSSVTCLRTNLFKRNLIIGGSNEGVVAVWDSNVNKIKFCMEIHNAPVTSVAFSPVNTDLVVSTGADRQFCFYDIVDNKIIANVSVENSITAVDFSPDGTFFVMAAQNGRVYIYDSRNIQNAIHSFEAHKSAIKHLAFQNRSELASDSSFESNSTESIIPIQSSEEMSKRNSDLFGMFIQVPSSEIIDSIKTSGNSMEGGDSFIHALGLDKNTTIDSYHQEESLANEGVHKWQENKESPTSANPTKTVHEKIGLGDSKQKQLSSTPKLLHQNLKPAMSPIISFNQTASATNVTIAEIQAAAKGAVKEELKTTLEEIKADIKFQATHTTYQMKRMLLDLQMAMVKEFIKVENYCNGIKDDITAESSPQSDNNYLMEENEQLKKRIEFLEQQIASLTLSQNRQNENISSS